MSGCSTQATISSKSSTLLENSKNTIEDQISSIIEQLENNIAAFESQGSGWMYYQIHFVDVQISKYIPFKHGSYIPLPACIQNKKACVNVKNNDNRCFKYAILSALHPAKEHVFRTSNYDKYMDKYNWEGISEPYVFDSNKLKKFEKNDGMSINIYCFDSMKKSSDIKTKKYIPIDVLYVSKYKSDKQIDLLIYQDGEDKKNDSV